MLRIRTSGGYVPGNLFEWIVDLMRDFIYQAGAVKGSPDKCWAIQYNTVWWNLFGLATEGESWKIVHFKLRRVLYDEIRRFDEYPNYVSAHILSVCLNVLGFRSRNKNGSDRKDYALQKVVLSWTQKNFLGLYVAYPDVANACLTGGISFDETNKRLVKTYASILGKEGQKDYLSLQEPLRPYGTR
jgi:hypothetical protein